VVQYLCEQEADKEARDDTGRTPLLWAASKGRFPVVQYLREQGAVKEAKDINDYTPLHHAASNGHLPVVQYLCEQGADKEARADGGRTPLHHAASNGHLPVVQCLCEKGVDVEAKTDSGKTPLHVAAENSTEANVIELLLQNGAILNITIVQSCQNTELYFFLLGKLDSTGTSSSSAKAGHAIVQSPKLQSLQLQLTPSHAARRAHSASMTLSEDSYDGPVGLDTTADSYHSRKPLATERELKYRYTNGPTKSIIRSTESKTVFLDRQGGKFEVASPDSVQRKKEKNLQDVAEAHSLGMTKEDFKEMRLRANEFAKNAANLLELASLDLELREIVVRKLQDSPDIEVMDSALATRIGTRRLTFNGLDLTPLFQKGLGKTKFNRLNYLLRYGIVGSTILLKEMPVIEALESLKYSGANIDSLMVPQEYQRSLEDQQKFKVTYGYLYCLFVHTNESGDVVDAGSDEAIYVTLKIGKTSHCHTYEDEADELAHKSMATKMLQTGASNANAQAYLNDKRFQKFAETAINKRAGSVEGKSSYMKSSGKNSLIMLWFTGPEDFLNSATYTEQLKLRTFKLALNTIVDKNKKCTIKVAPKHLEYFRVCNVNDHQNQCWFNTMQELNILLHQWVNAGIDNVALLGAAVDNTFNTGFKFVPKLPEQSTASDFTEYLLTRQYPIDEKNMKMFRLAFCANS